MKIAKLLTSALVMVSLAVFLLPGPTVSAHTSFPTGPYVVEIGWLNEPPVVGQPNAIVVNLSAGSQSSTATPQPTADTASSSSTGQIMMDYSGLTLQVSYGGQSKFLTLQPQSEDTPYNLMGVMTPAVMGKYTVQVNGTLTGDLGSTNVSINMQPEEVLGLDSVQFPNLSMGQTNQNSGTYSQGWLPIAGLVAGILGILLGAFAIIRKR